MAVPERTGVDRSGTEGRGMDRTAADWPQRIGSEGNGWDWTGQEWTGEEGKKEDAMECSGMEWPDRIGTEQTKREIPKRDNHKKGMGWSISLSRKPNLNIA